MYGKELKSLHGTYKDEEDGLRFHFSSIKVFQKHSLVATSMGKGIMIKQIEGQWENLVTGWPDETHVNRLDVTGNRLSACTNKGLLELQDGVWYDSDLAISCYQYKEIGRLQLAATSHGLWSKSLEEWKQIAYSHVIVYDFLFLPQFIILALDNGLAIYDRLTDLWVEFPLHRAITGLAIYKGHIIGITEHGELLQGNKQGGFDYFQFEQYFLFSVVCKGSEVYICTDRGLFRLDYIFNQMVFISVSLGFPVTDLDMDGSSMYMATLFQGIQTIAR